MTFGTKLLPAFLIVQLLLTLIITPVHAQGPTPFANCRLGLAGTSNVSGYNLQQLNLGRYLHYGTMSSRPSGLPAGTQYIHIVRVHQNKVGGWNSAYVNPPTYTITPDIATIQANAIALPGSLFFIGNEIDRIDWDGGNQDEMTPELYAKAYHDIRAAIKSADPTAKVGIGSVIQGTPLRLLYLDRVWDSYYDQYGHNMGDDIDAWNIHGFILREVRNSWGAEIPTGLVQGIDFAPEEGFLYGANNQTVAAEHHNVERFKEFTRNMRTWMAEKGERNKPLINTEMGVLYKNFGSISDAQVNAYMDAAFDYLFYATDSNIGYPADNNRLVQGWMWFSLDSDSYNGALFDPADKSLTTFGTNWKNYVTNTAAHPLAATAQQNLMAVNLRSEPAQYITPSNPVTFTLKVDVANSGNSSTNTGNNILVKFWDGVPGQPGSTEIGSKVIDDLPGCGEFTTVEVQWSRPPSNSTNLWYVEIVPITNETNTGDNIASATAPVITTQPNSEVSLTKTVDNNTPLEMYERFKYIIKITNNSGDTSTNTVVNDPLPGGIIFSSYKASQGTYFSSGPWLVGTLEVNKTATLTITVRVAEGYANQTIVNTATISSTDSGDWQTNNNTANVSIVPKPKYDVYLPISIK